MKRKFNNGMVIIEIISSKTEGFLNILWNNDILLKNIKKKNINSVEAEIHLKDYEKFYQLSKKYGIKIKINRRRGRSFVLYKWRKRWGLIFGGLLFFATLYYLSTFIWTINITSGKYITPFEIRRDLKRLNIKEGISAKNVDVYALERKMMEDNSNISWIKIRKEAGSLVVVVQERQEPPEIKNETSSCILAASRDAEILSVYTISGKAIVKKGDIVKKGQTLVLNKQGKEGEEYEIRAEGKVYGKTFYEKSESVPLIEFRRERTGQKIKKYFIDLFGKRIYFKNSEKIYKDYDKIEDRKFIFGSESYFEVVNKPYYISPDYAASKTAEKLLSEIELNFDKSVKVLDKRVYKNILKDRVQVSLIVVAEEDIAVKQMPIEEEVGEKK
ncbi:MAG: sporulation protein YqfD [Bacillota bacterium]|nr:sporulation protein YqfD [Bacillota bacterium]